MHEGQKAVCAPVTICEVDDKCRRVQKILTGKITYVHPKGRFALVEFKSKGGTLRECFHPNEMRLI